MWIRDEDEDSCSDVFTSDTNQLNTSGMILPNIDFFFLSELHTVDSGSRPVVTADGSSADEEICHKPGEKTGQVGSESSYMEEPG